MVLHLSTFHLEGGAGVAAARLHRALQKSGIDSHLLTQFSSREKENVTSLADTKWQTRKAWSYFIAERLAFYPHEKDASVRFAFSPAEAGVDISEHPLVREATVIHLHWVNFGFLSISSLQKLFLLGKPIVWTLHDMWTFTGGCHYSRGCDKFLTHCGYCPYLAKPDRYDISFSQFEAKEALYAKPDLALISPSNWLDQMVKNAPLTAGNSSKCIPNCIDTQFFTPLDQNIVRVNLGLPVDKTLILFTGANIQDVRKGFSYFQEALALAKSHFPHIEVMIFGKADKDNLVDFPVPVHYLGKITEPQGMVDAYNAADLIVVPSLEDNLPNTIMEAMSCGTPAVGFATGGIPEMIDHKKNGYVAELRSVLSLTEGIKWVLENDQGGKIAALAREKVLESYSEHIIADQYQQLYQSLLNG
ncbi:D-inositol-3-phosphate glycosyltransferase [Dyadobacter sp. CECT 9623]|uniref:D-inositol-3-phosphate glycosyltransferase n=1 Tax=Dyadobacter linearis TaxID=2823330 RepID=A0ABN7RCC6_9BACT|nr:glycosyltransferase family 4 protein [Dyadobacter sp. CECT 9623]CAG5069731.1 D-inositol-3-phosphate glycosyltransferase [Dyadobacter sp. CECT 9623]